MRKLTWDLWYRSGCSRAGRGPGMNLMTGHGAGMLAADDQLTPRPISVSEKKGGEIEISWTTAIVYYPAYQTRTYPYFNGYKMPESLSVPNAVIVFLLSSKISIGFRSTCGYSSKYFSPCTNALPVLLMTIFVNSSRHTHQQVDSYPYHK